MWLILRIAVGLKQSAGGTTKQKTFRLRHLVWLLTVMRSHNMRIDLTSNICFTECNLGVIIVKIFVVPINHFNCYFLSNPSRSFRLIVAPCWWFAGGLFSDKTHGSRKWWSAGPTANASMTDWVAFANCLDGQAATFGSCLLWAASIGCLAFRLPTTNIKWTWEVVATSDNFNSTERTLWTNMGVSHCPPLPILNQLHTPKKNNIMVESLIIRHAQHYHACPIVKDAADRWKKSQYRCDTCGTTRRRTSWAYTTCPLVNPSGKFQ